MSYRNAKIYKIMSNKTDKIYIGSTKGSLNSRYSVHKCHFETDTNKCSSFKILKYGDAVIDLIEKFPCKNRFELRQREQHWINHYKDLCINKYDAVRVPDPDYNKNYLAEYRKKKGYCKYCDKYYTLNNKKNHKGFQFHKDSVRYFNDLINDIN